jgi:hypothetical protein
VSVNTGFTGLTTGFSARLLSVTGRKGKNPLQRHSDYLSPAEE